MTRETLGVSSSFFAFYFPSCLRLVLTDGFLQAQQATNHQLNCIHVPQFIWLLLRSDISLVSAKRSGSDLIRLLGRIPDPSTPFHISARRDRKKNLSTGAHTITWFSCGRLINGTVFPAGDILESDWQLSVKSFQINGCGYLLKWVQNWAERRKHMYKDKTLQFLFFLEKHVNSEHHRTGTTENCKCSIMSHDAFGLHLNKT